MRDIKLRRAYSYTPKKAKRFKPHHPFLFSSYNFLQILYCTLIEMVVLLPAYSFTRLFIHSFVLSFDDDDCSNTVELYNISSYLDILLFRQCFNLRLNERHYINKCIDI